jgi:hypothetical protein
MSFWQCRPEPASAGVRMTVVSVRSFIEKCRARELFDEIPVVGEDALQRCAGVAGKLRALTS